MIIFNTPIQPRFIFKILQSWWQDFTMKKCEQFSTAQFNFVYFSYRPDFDYLNISLKSLLQNTNNEDIRNIYIYVDQKDVFTNDQIKELSNFSSKIIFRKINNFEWGSPKSTLSEIECYLSLAQEIKQPNDFMIKVDSDIVFIKSNKLQRLLRSKFHAAGDGHFLGYEFIQGGMYMIRMREIETNLSKVTLSNIENISRKIKSVGEDKVISTIFKDKNKPFHFTRLMLFPDEYRKIKNRTAITRWEFCCMHFHRDKENMHNYFDEQ